MSRIGGRIQRAIRAIAELPALLAVVMSMLAWRWRGVAPLEESRVRGLHPVRHYWSEFLKAHAADVRGEVLEIGETSVSLGIGGAAVTRAVALDVVPGPTIGVVTDLQRAWNVPDASFDAFLVPFTLHLLEDDRSALFHAVRIVRPGGVVLANFPSVSSHPADGLPYPPGKKSYVQRWYSPAGVRAMVDGLGLGAQATIEPFGNALGLFAYVNGLSTNVLAARWLARHDPATPVLVCARIVRPEGWPASATGLPRRPDQGA